MSDKENARRWLFGLGAVVVLFALVLGGARYCQPSVLAPEVDTSTEVLAVAAALDAIWRWDPASDPHPISVRPFGSADPDALIVTARLRSTGEVAQVAVDRRTDDGRWRAQGMPQPAADPTWDTPAQQWRGFADVPAAAGEAFEAVSEFVPAYLTGDESAVRAWTAASWSPDPLAANYDSAVIEGVGPAVFIPERSVAAWPVSYETARDGETRRWHSWVVLTEQADGRWRVQAMVAARPLPPAEDQ